jgi:hypothetical protein
MYWLHSLAVASRFTQLVMYVIYHCCGRDMIRQVANTERDFAS